MKLLSERNGKRRNRILRSFLLISYHIRTGLALTALCKSYSQTLEQLTKIYTQPFIPSLLLSSNTPAACFSVLFPFFRCCFFKHTLSLFFFASQYYIFCFSPFSCRCFSFKFKKPFLAGNISGPSISN